MFNIGDKIFYPMHGAGVIEKIEEKTILDETIAYYIVKMPGEVTVMVPTNKAENLGLRLVVSETQAKEVINVLFEESTEMSENWAERYHDNKERLKTGDIFEVADIYRNLSYRNRKRNLSTSEKKMLVNTRQVLLSELAISTNTSFDALNQELETKFDQTYALENNNNI